MDELGISSYSLTYNGMEESLLNSNIVVVSKKPGELSSSSLSTYLSNYSEDEIKLGKISSKVGDSITYELADSPTLAYNLILFVTSDLDLALPNAGQNVTNLYSIGAIELPSLELPIGISPKVSITIEFNSIESEELTINDVLSVNANSEEYEKSELGLSGINETHTPDELALTSTTHHKYGDNPISPEVSRISEGFVYKGTYYSDARLEYTFLLENKFTLDGVTQILQNLQSITYLDEDYLRCDFTSGVILVNVTELPNYIYGTNLSIPSEAGVFIKKDIPYIITVNPDFIIIKGATESLGLYRISIVDYLLKGVDSLSTILDDLPSHPELEQINYSLVPGTDLSSRDICTVFSHPKEDNWFFQKEYSNYLKNLNALTSSNANYAVEAHNGSLFVIQELVGGLVNKRLVVDYLGNVVNLGLGKYKLGIEGEIIIDLNDGTFISYLGDIRTSRFLRSNTDLYTIFPAGTPNIITPSELTLVGYHTVRDRIIKINEEW